MLESIFDDYVSNYDLNNKDIKLKYDHSYRVMNLAIKYAKLLKFSDEDIEIAKVIGLLHDIGRFYQLRVYDTYYDIKSIDHALYGDELLFKDNLIEKFNINKDWYPIISFAIRNHNKKEIDSCDDDRILMHAKLIRDIDKVDIIYLLGNLYEEKIKSDDGDISKEVLESINREEEVNSKDRKNVNDYVASKLAFAFDINNDIVIPELLEYYETYYEKVNNKKFEDIYNKIINYLKGRVDNYDRNGN